MSKLKVVETIESKGDGPFVFLSSYAYQGSEIVGNGHFQIVDEETCFYTDLNTNKRMVSVICRLGQLPYDPDLGSIIDLEVHTQVESIITGGPLEIITWIDIE